MSAIAVSDLRKAYGQLEVLHGLSFTVETGEVFALLGPNGAGKTTTVEILEGYRDRTSGDVSVLGHDPADRRPTGRCNGPAPRAPHLGRPSLVQTVSIS